MRAAGTFVNESYDETSQGEFHGTSLGRILITRTFGEGIEGSSTAELLTARTADGSAGYVAFDRVQASFDGRAGAFVLQHWGVVAQEGGWVEAAIVPGSGTGSFEGIRGRGTISVDGDGTHRLELDYELA